MVPRKTTLAALLGAVAITGVCAGTALAGSPPITGTEVSRFEESFSDEPFLCQDELYAQTVSGHSLLHFTYFPDTGAVHLHQDGHGKAVAVPSMGLLRPTRRTSGLAIRRASGPSRAATCSSSRTPISITSSHAGRMGLGRSSTSMRTSP